MHKGKLIVLAGLLALGLSGGAQAMPAANLAEIGTGVEPEAVRYVCNRWGRCWWQPRRFYRPYAYYPGPRFYGYGGPRFYGYGYRPWRRW